MGDSGEERGIKYYWEKYLPCRLHRKNVVLIILTFLCVVLVWWTVVASIEPPGGEEEEEYIEDEGGGGGKTDPRIAEMKEKRAVPCQVFFQRADDLIGFQVRGLIINAANSFFPFRLYLMLRV